MERVGRGIAAVGIALGFHATVAQVALMREALTVAGGNELVVGLGLACWLSAVGAGALLAAAVRGRERLLAASAACAGPACAFGLLVLRLGREILDLPPGGDPGLAGLAAILAVGLVPAGLSVGLVFTTAAHSVPEARGGPVSRLYLAEATGALAGGLAFTFLFAGRVPHIQILAAASSLPPAAVAAFPGRRAPRVACAMACLAWIACAFAAGRLDTWSLRRAFSDLDGGDLAAMEDTAYQRLSLGGSSGQYQLFADGRLQLSFPDPYDRPIPAHLAMTQHPTPRRVLLIGGGPTDRLEAVLAHGPERVVVTLLDERVFDVLGGFWPKSTAAALRDPRVQVVHDDGRRFASRTSERFDVILVDSGAPLSVQANRYQTREFFQILDGILDPRGSVTVLAPGGATVLAPEAARATRSILATIRSVFPHAIAIPGLTVVVHAARRPGVITASAETLAARFDARGVASDSFTSRRFAAIVDHEKMSDLERQIDRWPAEINTDARPVAFILAIGLWERGLERRGGAASGTWSGVVGSAAAFFIVGPLVAWAIWQARRLRRGSPRGEAAFSMGTTGAAGMAATVLVLIAFQTSAGTLYTGLGLLTALFMAGLAAGALAGRRLAARLPAAAGIVSDAIVLVFFLAAAPALVLATGIPALAAALSAAAGAVTGASFPAQLAAAAGGEGGDERRAVFPMWAADHLGAAVGAIATGVIWLPAYGIFATCVLFAALKTASLAGQAVLIRRRRTAERSLNPTGRV